MKKIILSFVFALALSLSAFADVRTTRDFAVVYDYLDTPVLDTSSFNLNGSAGSIRTVVASLSDNSAYCNVWSSATAFIGVYQNSVLKLVISPGQDNNVRCPLAAGAVGLRSMEAASVTSGKIVIQFMK